MTKPQVSILMSVFNDENYIASAIDSILGQTLKNWELIIFDDASTDNTTAIIKNYSKKDSRFKYFRNNKNSGLVANLNKGMQFAKASYIARIDSDDIWIDKKKLQKQIKFMSSNQSYGLVGCFANAVDTKGEKLYEISYPTNDADIRKAMLKHNCFIHSSVLFRHELLTKVDYYNISYHYTEDYDLYLKLGLICKFANIPEYMVNYRINPNGITRTKYINQLNEVLKVISKYKHNYSGFNSGYVLWNLRKVYPVWLRGKLTKKIKKYLFSVLY